MAVNHELRAAVKRGVRLLDAIAVGWRGRIDLTTLNMACPSTCICGQAFKRMAKEYDYPSGFDFAETLLSEGALWLSALGFDDKAHVVYFGFAGGNDFDPSTLQKEWKRVLDRGLYMS